MRCLAWPAVLPVVLLGGSAALAERSTPPPPPPLHLALSVNPPARWATGGSVAGSLYASLGGHHAIRANVASYEYLGNAAGQLIGIALGGPDEGTYQGRTTDLGIGWMYFSRRLWDGLTLEAGVLRRAREHREEGDSAGSGPEILERRTTTYAGRALIGWSFLLDPRIFCSLAVGLSVGHESGTETEDSFLDPMPTREDVARLDVRAEGFVRLGVAFDM